jgi:hypothetical protein
MQDKTYGWTVEMQLKSYANVFHIKNLFDIKSDWCIKVSGTVKGTIMAGIKIMVGFFKYAFK